MDLSEWERRTTIDEPRLSELDHQPPGAASGLKGATHAACHVLVEAGPQKVEFGLPVGAENDVVVFGEIIKISLNLFEHAVDSSELLIRGICQAYRNSM